MIFNTLTFHMIPEFNLMLLIDNFSAVNHTAGLAA